MLIITSDHGDNIGEHNMMFHWWCLYDTLIKVPLIIKYPKDINLAGEEKNIVQNVDLFPTIMDILDTKNENLHNQIQGNSMISGKIKKRDQNYAISELIKPFGPSMKKYSTIFNKFNRRLLSVRTKDKKYIWASDGNDEFYNLASDPSEKRNIVNSTDASLTELREIAKPWVKGIQKKYFSKKEKINGAKNLEFTSEIKDKLKRLGYF
jgi:arylsulfatase A-like enzyme